MAILFRFCWLHADSPWLVLCWDGLPWSTDSECAIFRDVLSDRCLNICSSLLSVSRLVVKVCLGKDERWGELTVECPLRLWITSLYWMGWLRKDRELTVCSLDLDIGESLSQTIIIILINLVIVPSFIANSITSSPNASFPPCPSRSGTPRGSCPPSQSTTYDSSPSTSRRYS